MGAAIRHDKHTRSFIYVRGAQWGQLRKECVRRRINKNSHLYREILGWEGVGNRQLLCFFKA
jgi:hypothetical protein